MELDEARELAFELMSDYGLYYWKFKFDDAKMRFGLCDEISKTISLSKHLVLLNDDEVVTNVILHEIAHALVGNRHKHNSIFQQKAIDIGCIYTSRYCFDIIRVPKNVVANCPKCGMKFCRYRMTSKKYCCSKCSGGIFNKEYLLVFERSPLS